MRNLISGITVPIVIALILILASLAIGIYTGWLASTRQLTPLEAALAQGITLVLALAGSFWGGNLSAERMAKQLVRPYARSSFRRVRAIYFGLSQIANELSEFTNDEDTPSGWALAIGRMQSTTMIHISTADDAMDEWKDLVPDEVNELRDEIASRTSHFSNK